MPVAEVGAEPRPEQRAQGISAGLEWLAVADAVVVYGDLGVSEGMAAELRQAESLGIPVELRLMDGWAPVTQELPVVTLKEPE